MLSARFDLDDYMALPEGYPAELVDGVLVKQRSPKYGHQVVLTALTARLVPLVGASRVLQAPVDVVVDRFNVYQPDLVVFERAVALEAQPEAVPLLAFEVLSPSSEARDRDVKTPRLLSAGCREVWLLAWADGWVERVTAEGRVRVEREDELRSTVLADFRVCLGALLPPA